MIVGFTTKTSARFSPFFCPLFRHCAVIADGILIQVATDGIRCFRCGRAEIRRLERAGWVFLELGVRNEELGMFFVPNFLTCVGFAKRAAGIRNPFILTPDGLFKAMLKIR